jgi:hypothetical protein
VAGEEGEMRQIKELRDMLGNDMSNDDRENALDLLSAINLGYTELEEDLATAIRVQDDTENEAIEATEKLERMEEAHERYEKLLNLIADPHNWTGNTWTPLMPQLDDLRVMADKALR